MNLFLYGCPSKVLVRKRPIHWFCVRHLTAEEGSLQPALPFTSSAVAPLCWRISHSWNFCLSNVKFLLCSERQLPLASEKFNLVLDMSEECSLPPTCVKRILPSALYLFSTHPFAELKHSSQSHWQTSPLNAATFPSLILIPRTICPSVG